MTPTFLFIFLSISSLYHLATSGVFEYIAATQIILGSRLERDLLHRWKQTMEINSCHDFRRHHVRFRQYLRPHPPAIKKILIRFTALPRRQFNAGRRAASASCPVSDLTAVFPIPSRSHTCLPSQPSSVRAVRPRFPLTASPN